MDVAFVVDTTGSMKDDIKAVKDSLLDIVKQVTKRTKDLEIRFGVVSYRDHPPQDKTYVTRVADFDRKAKRVQKRIASLKPSEGGDTPEAVADGLHDARVSLSWEKDAYKIVLLVGDAPPHGRAYNSIADDHFPDGCPEGYDPVQEVKEMRKEFGVTLFVFVCGCNPLVEESFGKIADSVEGGRYYKLSEAKELPEAILEILEDVGDLIQVDRSVLSFYDANDGSFDMAEAASHLKLELRDLKTSLSRLLELGYIARWPKGRPIGPSSMGLEIELGQVPNNIVAGKAFNYQVRIHNPSATVVAIRVVASLVTEDGVSEVTNERHEISGRTDRNLDLKLIPMTDTKGKATMRVEVFYGSRSLASEIYQTRVF
jgi:Mg-chelatase subunit ChlD